MFRRRRRRRGLPIGAPPTEWLSVRDAEQRGLITRTEFASAPTDGHVSPTIQGWDDESRSRIETWRAGAAASHQRPLAVIETNSTTMVRGQPGQLLVPEHDTLISLMGAEIGWTRQEVSRATVPESARAAQFDEPAILASAPGVSVYGHWLLDFVPRIVASLAMYPDLKVVLPRQLPGYTRGFLELLELDERRIIRLRPDEVGIFPYVVCAELARSGLSIWPGSIRDRWKQILDDRLGPVDDSAHDRRILVSREDWWGAAQRAHLGNFGELAEHLVRAGFEPFSPEQHGLLDQLRHFRTARIVVGEDGSALHNTVASLPGTTVVPVLSPLKVNHTHFLLANEMGHHLHAITGTPNDDHWVIDPERMTDVVERVVEGSG